MWNKTRKEIQHIAGYDFARGMTLEDISKKYNIPLHTIKRWYDKFKWKQKRIEYQDKYANTLFCKFSKRMEESVERNLETSKIMSQICIESMAAAYKKKNFLENVDLLYKLFKLVQLAASVPMLSMPSLPADIGEKILMELKNINLVKEENNGDSC